MRDVIIRESEREIYLFAEPCRADDRGEDD